VTGERGNDEASARIPERLTRNELVATGPHVVNRGTGEDVFGAKTTIWQ